MRDGLDQLLLRQPILARSDEVRSKLVGTIEGNQCADGDQAAIALGKLRTLPHIAEEHAVRELGKLWEQYPPSAFGLAFAPKAAGAAPVYVNYSPKLGDKTAPRDLQEAAD